MKGLRETDLTIEPAPQFDDGNINKSCSVFFENIIKSNEPEKPSRKKPIFPINAHLRSYLVRYGREVKLPVSYKDLQRYTYSVPLKNKQGKDTSWEKLSFDMKEWEHLRVSLVRIYAILKTEGDVSYLDHLDVSRIDFCYFGNSQPFRIRIINKLNDNYDHYYIKQADASRVYGLELEHLLSPNRITYFTHDETLIEEHIPGIPGDIFITDHLRDPNTNVIRLAKEFVKFNERCFVQLLGDMHSANFVVITTPDFEEIYYRIRPIDFDQQCYEGKKSVYLPQYFKQNNALIELGMKYMTPESVWQYQIEERSMIASRLKSESQRVYDLMDVMSKDEIAPPDNVEQLKSELAKHYEDDRFVHCKTMGEIVWLSLELVMRH